MSQPNSQPAQQPSQQPEKQPSKWALTKEERIAVVEAVNKHCQARDQHNQEIEEHMRQQHGQPQPPPSQGLTKLS